MLKRLSVQQDQGTDNMLLQTLLRTVLLAAVIVPLSACEKSMNISDEELIERIGECLDESNLTPGMAVACGNYQKECQRRGKKTGNYIC